MSHYPAADVERGLQALAAAGGSPTHAANLLETGGIRIPKATLVEWKKRHAQRYTQICQDLSPQIQNAMAADAEELALRYADSERALLDKLPEELDYIKGKDLPSALKSLATARAISTDKASVLRGRPTSINVNVSLDELVNRLSRLVDDPETVDAEVSPRDASQH